MLAVGEGDGDGVDGVADSSDNDDSLRGGGGRQAGSGCTDFLLLFLVRDKTFFSFFFLLSFFFFSRLIRIRDGVWHGERRVIHIETTLSHKTLVSHSLSLSLPLGIL